MVLKQANFEWDECCEATFIELKRYLAQFPFLTTPCPSEELYLYLVITEHAISVALVVDREKVQQPIYFINEALKRPELRYPYLEKFALALVTAFRQLRLYF